MSRRPLPEEYNGAPAKPDPAPRAPKLHRLRLTGRRAGGENAPAHASVVSPLARGKSESNAAAACDWSDGNT